jgi:hypothetical protein
MNIGLKIGETLKMNIGYKNKFGVERVTHADEVAGTDNNFM